MGPHASNNRDDRQLMAEICLDVCIMNHGEQSTTLPQLEQDDQWLDDVLSQTFPASDPVPWRHRETTTSVAVDIAVSMARTSQDGHRFT